MKSSSAGLFRILIASIVALISIVVAVVIHFDSEVKQREYDLAQSVAVNEIVSSELKDRVATIAELESEVNVQTSQINDLENEVSALEYEIESRTCQSITYQEFDRLVRLGTNYVITPEKMGWLGYWTIRENVLFERDQELARGYEVRIDLTPEDYSDDYQEIHSTVRAFFDSDHANSFFETKVGGEDKTYYKTSLDLGVPLQIWSNNPPDSEGTVILALVCGDIQADFKLKLLNDTEQAIAYLEEAATLFFHDISVWVP